MEMSAQDLLRYARSPEGVHTPNDVYARLQATVPYLRDEDSGQVYLLRWVHCDEVLRSPAFCAPQMLARDPRFDKSESLRFLASTLSNLDPPRHTGLRGAVQKSFSVPVLRKSKDFLDNLIAMRIESLRDKTQFDVVADYAATIPGVVICSLLGVPVEDQEMFSGWLADQFRLLGPSLPSDALLEEVDQSTRLLLDYTNDLIEKRRKNPQLDIISGLIAAQESDGIEISQRDMAVTTAILLAGGTDTTKTAISMGTRLLLSNPDQLQDYLGDPSTEASAFEEILRLGSPVVLSNIRVAQEDVNIHGIDIFKGEQVVAVIAAANLDPEKFTMPERFDIRRQPNRHIAFGGGVHVCVGNMLARMVGPAALSALIRAYPNMRLVGGEGEVSNSTPALRSLQRLDVSKSESLMTV